MPQTLIELAGDSDAPLLNMMPANGFPAQTYLLMLRSLEGYRAISLPPRALWGDQTVPARFGNWRDAADDLLQGLERFDLRDIVAVGHSLGGVLSMLALIKAPERFRALVMLDPVLLPQATLDMLARARDAGQIDDTPLVQGARRRRQRFNSREDAYSRFREKPIFADWSAEALSLYIEHGLRARSDGAGFELTWSPEWEAYYFSTVYQGIWQDLPKLGALAPTLIIRAGHSDTFPEASFARARSLAPDAAFHELKGQGHLFPQAAPLETARVINDWLRASL
jgi:pimeloyl-ACP methyl ester carboxylesterase